MPLAKRRLVPEKAEKKADPLRVAGDQDSFVESPVHRLQSGLSVFEQDDAAVHVDRYPGWFRVGFPLLASAGLWAAILWSIKLIR